MTPPKHDRARKEWLAAIKDGDTVAVLMLSDTTYHAWVLLPPPAQPPTGLYSVTSVRRIARKKFMDLATGRFFTLGTGKQPHYARWLVPLTDEIGKAVAARKQVEIARQQLCRTYFGMGLAPVVPDAKILACAAILWPDEFGGKS